MEIKIRGDVYILRCQAVLAGIVIFFFCRWLAIEVLNRQSFVVSLLFYTILLLFTGIITAYLAEEYPEFNTVVVGLIVGGVFLVLRVLRGDLPISHDLYGLLVIPVMTTALTYVGGIILVRVRAKV